MQTIEFINKNLHKNFRLKRLQKMSCMSPSKFKYVFKAVTDFPLTDYLVNKKMEKVCPLLLNTNMYVANIKISRPEITLEKYIVAIQRLNVAVIFLDERPFKGEDPQIIFETLNSLGKPLSIRFNQKLCLAQYGLYASIDHV